MSDSCAQWIAWSDQRALGEELSQSQQVFLAQHAETCPICGAEQAVWRELSTLVDASAHDPLGPARAPRVRHSELRARPSVARARDRARPSVARARDRALRPRARRVAWTVGALAACAALAFALAPPTPIATRSTQRAQVAQPVSAVVAPQVRISLTSGGEVEVDGRPVQPGASIALGSLLFARSGSACLILEPGIRACVAQGGLLRMAELSATRKRFALQAGKLAVSLDPQPSGHSFGVVTREGSAVAIGTAFSVEVPNDGGAVVTRVVHGTVLVQGSAGPEQRVEAHRMAPMHGPARALSAADEARERPLLEQAVSAPLARPGSLRVASAPAGARVFVDDRLVGLTPAALLLEPGEHALMIVQAPGEVVREHLHVGQGEQLVRNFVSAPPPAPAESAADTGRGRRMAQAPAPRAPRELRVTSEARAAAALLSRAREQRAHGDLDGALLAYRELFERHGQSSEAHAARIAYGEMLLSAPADARAALASFEDYLARGGPLMREASFGRVRALRALGRLNDERAALDEFLRSFPDGQLADALRARQRVLREP